MTVERTRPILRLKNPPKLPPLPKAPSWKCKPCGTAFVPTDAGEGQVRCPKCNARLGALEDFTAGRAEKLRARPIKPQTPSG